MGLTQFLVVLLNETTILYAILLWSKGRISGTIGLALQRSKKWLVRGLVKFATAVARLVCPDLLG